MIWPTRVEFPNYTNSSYNSVTKKLNNSIRKWVESLNRHFSKEDIQMTKRCIKRCSTSLFIREICQNLNIIWPVKYYLTLDRMAIIKTSTNNKCRRQCGVKGTLLTAGGNINCCSHYGKQYGRFHKKLKIELLCDPAIPLLGIHSDKIIIQKKKNTHTTMFIEALFTIVKTQKQLKHHQQING